MFETLNPASILNSKKNDYIIYYLLNKYENVSIYINSDNIDKCNNILVPGNHEEIKLNYEINEQNKEKKTSYGIISYDSNNLKLNYGCKKKIPNKPEEISEPLRIIIDKNIHNKLQDHFKKLIITNTKYNSEYKNNKSITELMHIVNNYNSIFNRYKTSDVSDRNTGLYGKFYDAMICYQEEKNVDDSDNMKNSLIKWYMKYLDMQNELSQNICNTLNNIFKSDNYYFQNNNPVRISIENSKGTPLHQDTHSECVSENNIKNFKKSMYEPKISGNEIYIEAMQNKCIFNCCYSIIEEYPEQAMYICQHNIDEMQEYEKSYFYQVKPNFDNEAILFNPSNRLHFRPNQYKGLSIRGDIRIVSVNNYNKNNLHKYRGPRTNLNVCFGNKTDAKKENVQYSVFQDTIFK